jgi:hypothetical protein
VRVPHGYRNLTVPEQFHDDARVYALGEWQRCGSVPEIVDPDVVQASEGENLTIGPFEVPGLEHV